MIGRGGRGRGGAKRGGSTHQRIPDVFSKIVPIIT